jgi:hypothetical protein
MRRESIVFLSRPKRSLNKQYSMTSRKSYETVASIQTLAEKIRFLNHRTYK